MEKNNLILVFYINCNGIDTDNIGEYISKIAKRLTPNNLGGGEAIFIPISHGETRVDCVNPKYITNEDLIKEHETLMQNLNENLKEQKKITELKLNENEKKD